MSVTVLNGDALEQLRSLPDESVQCCVTSPPYWGLRDYGHAEQMGCEATYQEYVEKMVTVFSEVHRVLKDDGTLWLNLGDSYNNSDKRGGGQNAGKHSRAADGSVPSHAVGKRKPAPLGIKPKDLCGIPWRVAFALQADGWYLRSDIIWSKPNPMPESVTDRPTKAHEYLFLLTKAERYYYDHEAIKEPSICGDPRKPYCPGQVDSRGSGHDRGAGKVRPSVKRGGFNGKTEEMADEGRNAFRAIEDWRNKRSVWTIPTQPYPEAHFATYPPDLIKPCILAGTRPAGKRCDCDSAIFTPTGKGDITDPSLVTGRAGMNRPRRANEGTRPITRREQRSDAEQMKQSPHRSEMESICGAAFAHYIRTDISGARPLPPAVRADFLTRHWLAPASPCECPIQPPDTVLDPFGGSGTTGMVALELGRRAILIELNPEYLPLIERRCAVTAGLGL